MSENRDMNEKQIDLVALFKSIWLRRKKMIKWSVIGLIAGIIIAISIPKIYSSTIKVAPENQTKALGGSVGTLASMMGVSTTTNSDGITEKVYPEIMKSTPFLLEFAPIEVVYDNQTMPLSDYLLFHQKRPWWNYIMGFPRKAIGWISSIGKQKKSATIENSLDMQYAFTGALKKNISTDQDTKTGIIDINSTFQDPIIAKIVADTLIVKLQRYMSEYRTAKTRDNLVTTQRLYTQAKESYHKAEEAYAKAVDRNQNLISKSAEVALDRLRNEKTLAFQVYTQLAQQVEVTKIKLQEETPIVTVIEPALISIDPIAPRKMSIIVSMMLLSALICAMTIAIKFIRAK